MKFVRRVHLYSGLALVPFVALYGLTALLFNHPEIWSSNSTRHLSVAEVDEAGRVQLAPASQLARELVDELGDDTWSLDSATEPRLAGRVLLSSASETARYSIILGEPNGSARVSERPRTPSLSKTVLRRSDGERLTTGRATVESIQTAAASLVPEVDGRWRVRSAPRLEFGLIRDGSEAFRARYDLREGSIEVSPTSEPRPVRTARSFLLRLHTAHGYPSGFGVVFWWAVLVDVMSIAMLAWAISGLLMWWQMKKLRRAGLVALALCACVTVALIVGQWARIGTIG